MAKAFKLKGTRYGVDRDYPREIVTARRELHNSEEAKYARANHNRVQIKYPAKLVINGQVVCDKFPECYDMMMKSRVMRFEPLQSVNEPRSIGSADEPISSSNVASIEQPGPRASSTGTSTGIIMSQHDSYLDKTLTDGAPKTPLADSHSTPRREVNKPTDHMTSSSSRGRDRTRDYVRPAEKSIECTVSDHSNIGQDYGLSALLYTFEGDLRKAITYLQSAARLKAGDTISQADIYEISGVVPDDLMDSLLTVCHSNSYEKMQTFVEDIISEGHAASQVLLQLHDKVVQLDELNGKQKSIVMEKIAVVDKCLMDGADEYLQLMALGSTIMQQICHPDK